MIYLEMFYLSLLCSYVFVYSFPFFIWWFERGGVAFLTSIAKLVPGCAQFSLFLARFQSSKYQISENFTKRFGFSQFSLFLVNFGCFLVKKRPKNAEIQKKFFYSIFFVGKHLHTKFQKISSNGLDFGNFFLFFLLFFG